MIIISSSAYVTQDLQGELGKIPPVFLPLANKKLIFRQVSALKAYLPEEMIILSIPKSYQLMNSLRKSIEELKVIIVQVPDHLNLSQSILFVINTNFQYIINKANIKILYGDTLIGDYQFSKGIANLIGVSQTDKDYNWEYADSHHSNSIWCGFFKFSNLSLFLESLTLFSNDFLLAIKNYISKEQTQFIDVKDWHDLGHLNSYFETRTKSTTQRSFNGIDISHNVVTKYSHQIEKIRAEALWFENIPKHIKINTPMLIQHDYKKNQYSYQLEYLSHLPLNELYLHGNMMLSEWEAIFRKIEHFRQTCLKCELTALQIEEIRKDFGAIINDKTYQRVYDYLDSMSISHDFIEAPQYYQGKMLPSLKVMIERCISAIQQSEEIPGVLHGDLCFSNIIFDSRRSLIKVFDPRGMNANGELTIYGDLRYDLAKLSHSVLGLYDFIIAGEYVIKNEDSKNVELGFNINDNITDIHHIFKKIFFVSKEMEQSIQALVVLLFLSMLPLHADHPERQKAMLLNAKRVYLEID